MIYANDYVFWGVPRYILMVDRVYKTAAMVDKVAADLEFRAYEVRWLLPEKYFEIAATSAACLLCLYIIGVLNSQRFGVFVHTILEYGNQLVVVASEKSCVYWASE